eukprot:s1149_g10.t1
MGRLSILPRRRQNIPPPLAFHIAVACSWWAYRVGVAKLQVHRGSVVQCVGRREHWLEIDPRALREWAMAPLVITLGLRPIDLSEAARIPIRVEVEGILREDNILPPGIVYVDRGHHSHRLSVIQWVSPFVRVTLMVLTSELKRRWAVVDACLRARQPAPIRQVTKQRDITLFILLCLLVSWGDPTFPKDFLFGMATVGTAPWYGVFPRQASRNISLEDVLLDAAASNAQIRASLRSSKDASFLLEQSVKDVENGFCTQPFRHSELLHMVKGQLFRLILI